RRIHPARDHPQGLLEQLATALVHSPAPFVNSAAIARAAAWTSAASNTAETTATMSAPASMACAALAEVMPPMATTGSAAARFACAMSASGARTAPGLVDDAKTL